MKTIVVLFEDMNSSPTLPSDRLEAAAKLIDSLLEDADFRVRFVDFLKSDGWEVPTVSWQPPPAT